MKLAYSVLKLPILILLLTAGTSTLSAQNCYHTFLEEGKKAFDDFQFETAIKKFEAAKVCSDRPASTEIEEWLTKAQNGYIDRLQLIASRYLTSEGQRAFQQKDYRLAFRLYQEALKYKSDNEQTIQLQQQLLPYLADYQYDLKIDPRFYTPQKVALNDGKWLVVFDQNETNKYTLMKVIETQTGTEKQVFEVAGSLSNYQFSNDGKWLAVEYFDPKSQTVKLSLWEVESQQVVQNFDEIYRSDPYKTFTFSENCEKLVYRTEEIIETVNMRFSTNEDVELNDTIREKAYALNVFDLLSQKTVFKTDNFLDYYSDDADSGSNPFRGQPFRQDLINAKISMKFATEGIIATNNENFVLKANEFRIRESPDFAISADGKKIAFNHFGEEEQATINFRTEAKITFGPRPMTLIGNLKVIDLESNRLVFNKKSDYKELPQRMLPFKFSYNSDHLIFIDSRKWMSTDFSSETNSLEVTDVGFQTGFNIYNLEKKKYLADREYKFHDFFATKNNLIIVWNSWNFLVSENGQFQVYDLKLDSLIFEENIKNDFSHFYDVKTENDLLCFSTFDPNNSKTSIKIIDSGIKKSKSLKIDFVPFNYTYLRTSTDSESIAFLKDHGKTISIWDLATKKQIREINCQSQIAEFDFSKDNNYLIIRDEENFLKMVNLNITDDLYNYYDGFLESLTEKDRKKVGIDW